ncbi:MAG TPA: hypothetical protein VH879_07610 [Gemmatimonadales bacterium]|jgi:hypothetical protein
MGKLTRKLATKGADAIRKAYEKVETRVMAATGRKVVRGKVRTVANVSRKAAKAGLVAGAVSAAGVVVREIRKRRSPS